MVFRSSVPRYTRPVAAIGLALGMLAVTACAGPAASAPPSSTPETASYPLTLDNCGTEVTIEVPLRWISRT